MRRVVKGWGREQCRIFEFKRCDVFEHVLFKAKNLNQMKSHEWIELDTLSLRRGDTICIIYRKVGKSLSDLHSDAQKTSPKTESSNIYSHHSICLPSLPQGLQGCCWFEKSSERTNETKASIQMMVGDQMTAILWEDIAIIIILYVCGGRIYVFSYLLAPFPTRLTHSFILKEEPPPKCPCGNQYTIKHILIECTKLTNIRWRFYNVDNMNKLFRIIDPKQILNFLKRTGLQSKM